MELDDGYLGRHTWTGLILPTQVQQQRSKVCHEFGLHIESKVTSSQGVSLCKKPSIRPDQIYACSLQVEACLSAAAESIEEGQCPWAAVTIRGFKHAPVFWERREKSQIPSSSSGAAHIVLLLPGKQYIIFMLNDASDAF